MPWRLNRLQLGRSPAIPFTDPGPRMEPPVSPPIEPLRSPAATEDPEPADEPAGLRSIRQGLRGVCLLKNSSVPPMWNSWVASVPMMIAPASRKRAMMVQSSPAMFVVVGVTAARVQVAFDIELVLDTNRDAVHGAPGSFPAAISCSACFASAMASSAITRLKAYR